MAAWLTHRGRIILDGEMLVWDPETGKTQAFGNLKTAALSEL